MINASAEFVKKINNGANIVNYAELTLRDGTALTLEPKDFMVGGCQITDNTSEGQFGIGNAIGKRVSIKLANHKEQFSNYDFYMAYFVMYCACLMDDSTVERVRKGKYYVTVPETPGDIICIDGVDSMYKFDKKYEPIPYPATLHDILSGCCIDCGVEIGFTHFDNYNFVVDTPPEDVTYREVVSFVAQIAGYNARINNNDALELVWYQREDEDIYNVVGGNYLNHGEQCLIDGGNFQDYSADTVISGGAFTDTRKKVIHQIKSLNVGTDLITITGVKVVGDTKESMQGEEGYLVCVENNPFVDGKESEVAEYLGNRLIGFAFRIFQASILNNPLFEPYDTCCVEDRKGNQYESIINSVIYIVGGYTQISCNAESPIRNENIYTSAAAKAIVTSRRETDKKISRYDQIVQNMNQLAGNAMGYHTSYVEQDDGSRITYLHDKPTLEESLVIYKMTADGFFLSQDGGQSYTAGFDSEGNATVNILAAIGIVCDWIRGGTLTLGGDNDINGAMTVLDANGDIVGKFNKDGLWAENGYFKGIIESKSANITGGYINIETNAMKYDTIHLRYGGKETKIGVDYIRLSEGAFSCQMVSDQISMESVSDNSFLRAGSLSLKKGIKNTIIVGDSADFGGSVSIKDNLSVLGEVAINKRLNVPAIDSAVTFSKRITILSTGSLTLNGVAGIECRGKAEFYGGIYEGTAFSVDTVGNVTASGIIKSTGNYESDLYSLRLRNNLSVDGATTLRGSVKIGDASGDYIGFFGSTGSGKKTVSTILSASSATAFSNATKINEVINALKAYGMM